MVSQAVTNWVQITHYPFCWLYTYWDTKDSLEEADT